MPAMIHSMKGKLYYNTSYLKRKEKEVERRLRRKITSRIHPPLSPIGESKINPFFTHK